MRFHKFQNSYVHIYLRFKSCILVPDGGPWGPKHIASIYDIIKSVFVFAGNMYKRYKGEGKFHPRTVKEGPEVE